ncbi:DUF2461 domain-containing protein [Maribacter algarum]|uniref:DUF2461 domain-containing protein n=1 Tax=Maribacter algarum (ex Zhang et al. 2020) TaxID=2578118 RepID=A0A5S3PRK2_9FLAO|nr:DUF2461 domain-containing protein [Maribacter algarum]TMM57377.1 DUF2461 domain-containing protein [Maribacter algarum]
MQNSVITPAVFSFLKELEKNNNRDWFTENKKEFKSLETEMKSFFNTLGEEVSTHDKIEKIKVFRIYRDIRFSKNKTPYKINFSSSLARAGAKLRGGYYTHIEPRNASFIAAGFWGPEKEDLLRIRKELELDASEFRAVIGNRKIKNIWGDLIGDEVKTAPKGFDKEHPNIDLIRKKQFIFTRKFTDKEVLDPSFLQEVSNSFKAIRSYFDLMSDVLTTNLNGESLLD